MSIRLGRSLAAILLWDRTRAGPTTPKYLVADKQLHALQATFLLRPHKLHFLGGTS